MRFIAMVHCIWRLYTYPCPASTHKYRERMWFRFMFYPRVELHYTHYYCPSTATWAEGGRGAYTEMYLSHSLSIIPLSLSPILDISLIHKSDGLTIGSTLCSLYGLTYVFYVEEVLCWLRGHMYNRPFASMGL